MWGTSAPAWLPEGRVGSEAKCVQLGTGSTGDEGTLLVEEMKQGSGWTPARPVCGPADTWSSRHNAGTAALAGGLSPTGPAEPPAWQTATCCNAFTASLCFSSSSRSWAASLLQPAFVSSRRLISSSCINICLSANSFFITNSLNPSDFSLSFSCNNST